jgi:hypothetical protein
MTYNITGFGMEATEKTRNIIRTTVRMDSSLHQELSDLVHDLGRGLPPKEKPSIDSAIQDAVRAYLGSPAAAGSSPDPLPAKDEAPPTLGIPRGDWHAMLDRILDSEANYLVMAIVTNLLAFGRDAEQLGKTKPPKRYEAYEAKVLRALSELMDPEAADPLVVELAAFLADANDRQREIVLNTIKAWTLEKKLKTTQGKAKDAAEGKRTVLKRRAI